MTSKQEVIKDCMNLSSGTMATLTGKRKYADLNRIQNAFVVWVIKSRKAYPNWVEAWKAYERRRKK